MFRAAGTATNKPKARPGQTAKVRSLACVQTPVTHDASRVDLRIVDRIKKCLDRAKHPNTPEAEAKAALRMASRLMALYNVTQADLLAEASDAPSFAALGGESVVEVVSTRGQHHKVLLRNWVRDVATAMTVFFDCKVYSTRRRVSIDWTFYGISANTVAAAMAFEMAHNLALEWARVQVGTRAKNSYCLGLGRGLTSIAYREKKEEEGRAKESQNQPPIPDDSQTHPGTVSQKPLNVSQHHRQEVGIQGSQPEIPGSPQEIRSEAALLPGGHIESEQQVDSSDESVADFDEAWEKPLDMGVDLEEHLHQNLLAPWGSTRALIRFRESAETVAEEYLKAQNLNLRSSKRRATMVGDQDAYQEGIKDSRQMDVKRRRIEGPS